jgi:DNA processing protein
MVRGMPLPRRPLTEPERLDWLRLIRTENVGPITFHRLLERYGSARAAIDALPDLARQGGRAKPLKVAAKAEAERELAATARIGVRVLASCEPDYPAALAAIDDAPPLIFVLGHAHLLARPAVALVGARNASLNGRKIAETFARGLAEAGFLVVSGLARGIDTAAHRGALDCGTAAVVAGGVDVVYPEENTALQADIARQGVLVAENPVGIQPQARHFPRRNRVISGLSLGVVVVEAALRSGSLITARMAADQGREVLAVPGSPLDPRAEGTNALLRQGVGVARSVEDIVETLKPLAGRPVAERPPSLFDGPGYPIDDEGELARARAIVLESLGPTPVAIDELVRGCQLSPPVVLTVVLELELAGRVQRQPGNLINVI